ncbi:hypothetical protein NM688_g9095 [Phlebia brevispora]|uniref:Uncharacterized protein n=1 Tax=Phlebia brevispora TaxID=194682 RepID=A0ACC1RJF1_9APHY|nr:hypothetical protein NM688_g9095 [Phlebia brevispora]
MQVDGASGGEWWCKGKKKCDRHAGWQKLRQAEMELEKELQDAQLDKLTTQEREIRKQIEGVVDQTAQKSPTGPAPLQPHNGETLPKPEPKPKPQTNGTEKKGKKRKADK